MRKIGLAGCGGRMGRVITEMLSTREDLAIAAGFEVMPTKNAAYPVYADVMEYQGEMDVMVDFSTASALDHILEYCVTRKIPLLVAATGHSEAQLAALRAASEIIPVFKTANLSLGIAVMDDLVRRAAKILGADFDIEVLERHHNQKLDAPSGTAMSLAHSIQEELPFDAELVYDRHERREKRPKKEIGMHAVRGGTIVGEHEVLYAGVNETISISHFAQSREVFAAGALHAVNFLADCAPGMYDMRALVASIK